MIVAEPAEQRLREIGVADLGLLQAEDVGRFLDAGISRRSRSRARIELMFQDAILREEDMAGLAGACRLSTRTQMEGPRSGGVERGPTKRCYARSIAKDGSGNRGKTRTDPQSQPVLLSVLYLSPR